MLDWANLDILNPKQSAAGRHGWEGFFPYYAGYPESFVSTILDGLNLPSNSLVYDPWNGSGTTTFACVGRGFPSWGMDLNPVMVIVAKARLLAATEADSLVPLCTEIIASANRARSEPQTDDPLLAWFDKASVKSLRNLELSIRRQLVGAYTIGPNESRLTHLSTLAAAFYVALFSTSRSLTGSAKTANPTWVRKRVDEDARIVVERNEIHELFAENVREMAKALHASRNEQIRPRSFSPVVLDLADSSSIALRSESVDLVVTSPPYCTRLDYVASTRIELAVVQPWLKADPEVLRANMIGTVRVPRDRPAPKKEWGRKCISFLKDVQSHPSKASSGYYLKGHLDYYEKMYRSVRSIASSLKSGGGAVFVVQDSYYKDVWNPVTDIISDMCRSAGLHQERREDFPSSRSMRSVNSKSRSYAREVVQTESVICFSKNSGK
jgi:hypothetical protein